MRHYPRLPLAFLLSFSVTANPVHHDGELSPDAVAEVKLTLAENDYVKGMFNANYAPDKVELLDKNNQLIRRLVDGGSHSGRIIFIAEQTGEYRIRVTSGEHTLRYQLSLDPPVSKARQVASPDFPQSPTLAQLAQQINSGSTTKTFWQQIEANGSPLIEPGNNPDVSLVTFLWRGAKQNVRLFGAPYGGHQQLSRLGNSDVWYKTYSLPNTTRLSYQLAPDVPTLPGSARDNKIAILATAQRDPFNPHIWPSTAKDKYNMHSVLDLADEPASNWLIVNSDIPSGHTEHYQLSSEILGNSRQISIYTPARVEKGEPTPVLVLFDGQAYQSKVPTSTILDNLIAAKKIPPTRAIFVANPSSESRSHELPPNEAFARFMAKELMPWFNKQAAYTPAAKNTILAGSSFGGLASSWVALRYPDVFGGVLSLSGSYWWGPDGKENEWLSLQYAISDNKPLRFYLNAGLFESGLMQVDILESNRHFHQVLLAKGYDVKLQEVAGGHDYYSWQVQLTRGLIHLLGNPAK